jgi:cellulose biosynthesis protein BcsQ
VGYMAQTCQELRQTRQTGPALLGIVPNMARRRTNEHYAQLVSLTAAFGAAVWPPIPLSVRVAEATARGTTVFDLPDAVDIAAAFTAIGERVVANAR